MLDLFGNSLKSESLQDSLFEAIIQCKYKRVKELLRKIPVTVRNAEGHNTLIAALRVEDEYRRDRLFRYLVKRGANFRWVQQAVTGGGGRVEVQGVQTV